MENTYRSNRLGAKGLMKVEESVRLTISFHHFWLFLLRLLGLWTSLI